MKLYNVIVADHNGREDHADAMIQYAEHEDGTPLTEEEYESIPQEDVYYYAEEQESIERGR